MFPKKAQKMLQIFLPCPAMRKILIPMHSFFIYKAKKKGYN